MVAQVTRRKKRVRCSYWQVKELVSLLEKRISRKAGRASLKPFQNNRSQASHTASPCAPCLRLDSDCQSSAVINGLRFIFAVSHSNTHFFSHCPFLLTLVPVTKEDQHPLDMLLTGTLGGALDITAETNTNSWHRHQCFLFPLAKFSCIFFFQKHSTLIENIIYFAYCIMIFPPVLILFSGTDWKSSCAELC